MPYFLIEVRGDSARAAGLLAKSGIQNVVDPHTSPAPDDVPWTLTARLSAEDGESALRRVRAALEGEPFTVEDNARSEPA
jgi:hypothetical protein